MKHRFSERPWYNYAAALCIAVVLYVALTHVGPIAAGLKKVGSFFSPVVVGLVLAYLMNPLLRFFRHRVFGKLRSEKLQKSLSLVFTILTVLVLLAALLLMLIPQLYISARSFVENLDENVDSLQTLLSRVGISLGALDLNSLLEKLTDLIQKNAGAILNTTVSVGKSLGSFVVSFLLSIYLLGEKDRLLPGIRRLLRALLPAHRYEGLLGFCTHANGILTRYISYSLLESLIVGLANALFMLIMGMSYTPLVSTVVAVTNLIPTFGPVIGAAVGAFVLLLAKPMHALWFLLFTLVLQTIDGYLLKPKLFGGSLGVSGLWILVAIVIGGQMFGVVGMLLAIPCAAILDDLYYDFLLPKLEARRAAKEEVKNGTPAGPGKGDQ